MPKKSARRKKNAEKASDLWYLAGLTWGLGYFIALIYLLVSKNKNRLFGLLYLLGPLGAIILLVVFMHEDKMVYSLSLKMLVGNLITLLIAVPILLYMGISGLSYFRYYCMGVCHVY